MIEKVFDHIKYARKIPKIDGRKIWEGSKEEADRVSHHNRRINEILFLRQKLNDPLYAAEEIVYLSSKIAELMDKYGGTSFPIGL